MNVPKLRFKEFDGEWEESNLGEVVKVLDGDRGKNYPSGNDFSTQGHTLFLSAANVTKKGFSFDERQYITQNKSDSLGNGKLEEDDIVLTSRGSLGHIAWYNCNVKKNIPFARINSGMLILRSNKNISPRYISQFLVSPIGKRKIDVISFGSAQPQLTKKDIQKYKLFMPKFVEQQKIGFFFQQIDKKIQLQQEKIDLLKEQKKGFMQKIFSQELRFKDEDGQEFPEWVNLKLGDILILLKDGTHGTHKDVDKGPYLLSAKNIKNGTVQITDNDRKIPFSEYQSIYKNYQLKKDDILLTIVGSIGEVALYQSDRENIAFQRSVAILRTKSEVNSLYLSYIMQSTDFQKSLKIFQVVSAQPGIYLGDLSKIKINISLNQSEQLKVSSFLSKIDKKINLELQKLKELNQQKHSLMQQMFI